ncbi:MAG: TetR family transcriptional regulator [Mycobacterium sp.]|nr:TetR family transcriptional regulator [Mycobacterium sp.]
MYRRFPTREQLVDATYRYETARLAGRASALLDELAADRALREWMSEVLDYLAAKHGMADTLETLLQDDEQLSSQTRAHLTGAIEARPGSLGSPKKSSGTTCPRSTS